MKRRSNEIQSRLPAGRAKRRSAIIPEPAARHYIDCVIFACIADYQFHLMNIVWTSLGDLLTGLVTVFVG
ncbi:hypothetical protein Scep_027883 [Stephania cephalantha]|uniref:Uncharacterized protein n=1 Tax=Stephania cephalantha TaxID=152367 RepID=A0AAP0HLJ2_9MAGN